LPVFKAILRHLKLSVPDIMLFVHRMCSCCRHQVGEDMGTRMAPSLIMNTWDWAPTVGNQTRRREEHREPIKLWWEPAVCLNINGLRNLSNSEMSRILKV